MNFKKKNHGKGAIYGGNTGLVIATSIGGLATLTYEEKPHDTNSSVFFDWNQGQIFVMVTIGGIVLIGILSLVIGAIAGAADTYILNLGFFQS